MQLFDTQSAKLISKLGIAYDPDDLLCLRDLGGRILVVNQAWERLLGYPLAEIENQLLIQLVHPQDREPTRRTMALINDAHRANCFKNRYRARNGIYHALEWRAFRSGPLVIGLARAACEERDAA